MYITRNDFDHVVFILHTHSDDTTGALWYTSKSDEWEVPLSTPMESVSFLLRFLNQSLLMSLD